MNGKTHTVIAEATMVGITVTCTTLKIRGMTIYPGIGILPASIAAVLADIDLQSSSLGRKYPLISNLCTHRGFTHTGVVGCTIYALFLATSGAKIGVCTSIAQSLLFGFAVAYISHIIADLMNGKGVPLLWPIISNKIHLMRIVTKSSFKGKDNKQSIRQMCSEPLFMIAYILLVLLHISTTIGG